MDSFGGMSCNSRLRQTQKMGLDCEIANLDFPRCMAFSDWSTTAGPKN